MYIKRTIEKVITRVNKSFPVILITGPRQVGKTTVFQKCIKNLKRKYISLDNMAERSLARTNPELFLDRHEPPLLIDEVQYAPELFSAIKERVDNEQKTGMYWLTGSQQFHLMKNISESLAGRVAILDLQGFSQDEKFKNPNVSPFLPTIKYIKEKEKITTPKSLKDIYKIIWRGSLPRICTSKIINWNDYYSSYIRTYIERDIRDLTTISNEMQFLKFLTILASRTGQILVYSDIARDLGTSVPTIKSWISLLQTSGIIYLLYPYSNNISNRLTKQPKLYFLDTGLVCYLTGWTDWNVLEKGAMNGAILETYVVSEILKSYLHNGKKPYIYFYRDIDKKEIDIILEENNILYPIEIKKKSSPTIDDIKAFNLLKKFKKEIGLGAVICFSKTYLPITKNVYSIPIEYL